MWERIIQSEIVVRQSVLPVRVVLDRDRELGEYRTYLEIIQTGGEATFLHGRIFKELSEAQEDFERRSRRL